MVRWKIIIGSIAIIYIFGLLILGGIIMILMGPGEIYYYSINGRIHPDLHYHTIYPEWIKLWVPISLLTLPALLILYFDPFDLKMASNLD